VGEGIQWSGLLVSRRHSRPTASRAHARPARSTASATEDVNNHVKDGDDNLARQVLMIVYCFMVGTHCGDNADDGHDDIHNRRNDCVNSTSNGRNNRAL
jgi:hypothetical protein